LGPLTHSSTTPSHASTCCSVIWEINAHSRALAVLSRAWPERDCASWEGAYCRPAPSPA
jgi:hypothetical protein